MLMRKPMIIAGFCFFFFFFPNGLCSMIVLSCGAFGGVTSVQPTVYHQANSSILLCSDSPTLLHGPWEEEGPHCFTLCRGRRV